MSRAFDSEMLSLLPNVSHFLPDLFAGRFNR